MGPNEAEQLATYWTAAQRAVAAFIRTLVPEYNESEDILQRVAVALVRKFQEYDRQRPFVAWAIGIAKREVVLYYREMARDRHVFKDSLVDQIAEAYQRMPTSPVHEFLDLCLDELDDRARKVIHLRYVNGLRTLQIAAEMHMTDTAVRKLLSRARILLRDCVNRNLNQSRRER
jgi:RNA polymerase sigma-70 factor, ECF subfamily